MKKFVCLFMSLMWIFSLVKCDDKSTTATPSSSPSSSTVVTSNTTETTEATVNSTITTAKPETDPPKNATEVLQPLSFVFQECQDDCPDETPKIFDYFHGEGLERCGVSNGLLCIAKDNLRKIKPNWKGEYFEEYSNYHWKTIRPIEKNFSHENYKEGVEVMMLQNKSDVFHAVSIATSLTESSSCSFSEDIRFLEPKSVKCLRSIPEACSYARSFLRQFIDSKILQSPQKNSDDIKTANMTFELCHHSVENCTKFEENGEKMSSIFETICIDNITVKFITNSSSIMNVSIIASSSTEEIVPCDIEDSSLKIIQSIEIKFEEVNSTKTKLIKRKLRAYEDGDILIITKLHPINESDPQSEKIFDLFRNDSLITKDDLRMKIPYNKNGKCVLTDEIRFNENSLTKCTVELNSKPNVNQSICQHYQFQLVDYLIHAINLTTNYTGENLVSNIFVSKTWLPERDFNSWKRIEIRNLPLWEPQQRDEGNGTSVTCLNLPTKINYLIKSSKIFSFDAKKYENIIQVITSEFESTEELNFPLKGENYSSKIKIDIRIQFFDDWETRNESSKTAITNVLLMNIIILILYSIL